MLECLLPNEGSWCLQRVKLYNLVVSFRLLHRGSPMVYIRYMTVKQTNINQNAMEVPNAPILIELAFSTILASL